VFAWIGATFDIPIAISEGTANKQADQSPVPINVSEGTTDKQATQADRSYEVRQTKSGRPSRHPKRYGFLAASPIASFIDDLEKRILHPNAFVTHQLSRAHSHSLNRDLPFTEDDLKFPLALPANKTNANPDTPTYKQAMSGEHRNEFETAMQT